MLRSKELFSLEGRAKSIAARSLLDGAETRELKCPTTPPLRRTPATSAKAGGSAHLPAARDPWAARSSEQFAMDQGLHPWRGQNDGARL
jgi:hypothetical protein